MRLRLVAAACALAALAVHLVWTRPFRAEAAVAADEYRRLRDERRHAVADRTRDAWLSAAPTRIGVVPGGSGAPMAAAARRLVVGTLASSGVSTARVRVTRAPGGPGPVGASVHLTGLGSLDDVARFTGELARPGNGLVLSSVRLVPRNGDVELSFDALALGEAVTSRRSAAFVVLAVVLGAAILFALSWSPAVLGPGPSSGDARPTAERRVTAAPQGVEPGRLRDVFAYDEPAPTAAVPPTMAVSEVAVPPPLAPPPPNPVALVGFVRQGGAVRAALSIRGEVTVLARDGSAGGYVVLAIDEDRGVTLRDPDGAEITLAPPR